MPRLFRSRLMVTALTLLTPSCAHVAAPVAQSPRPPSTPASRDEPITFGPRASRAGSQADQRTAGSTATVRTDLIQQVEFEESSLPGPEIAPPPPAPPEADGDRDAIGPEQATSDGAKADVPPEDKRPDHTEADLASGSVLTVDELEQIALTNNPTVQQAAAVVEKARGIRRQVGLYPNPTIGYSGEEIGDDGTAGKQGGFISQTIVTGGKLSLNRAVTDQEISNLIWELDAQRYRVRNSVRRQFYEALGAQRRVEVARELLGIVERGVETSEGLLKGQEVAKPDVLQAKIQFSEVHILLRNAEYDFEAAWKQLTSLIGQPQMPPTALAGSLEDGIPACEFEAVFAQLMSISPELQAARSRVARARVQIRRQEVQPIPNVLAQAGVSHDNASGDDLTSIQLGIPLPIFNRNQGNIHLAVAEHRRAVSDLRRLELSLRVRLADAFRDYSQAQNQVSQYRNQILPTARENLDLTEEGYRAGEFDLIRVLTARRSVIEANLAYIRSLVSARQAHVEITGLLLTGGLNDIPDAVGSNLEGIGLRDETLSSQ